MQQRRGIRADSTFFAWSSNYPRNGGNEQTVYEVPYGPGEDDLVGVSFFLDEFFSHFVESLLKWWMVVVESAFLGSLKEHEKSPAIGAPAAAR